MPMEVLMMVPTLPSPTLDINKHIYIGEFIRDKRSGFGRYESKSGNYTYEGKELDNALFLHCAIMICI